MPYNPFEDCEDCPAFDSSDPYEENDVAPFVDCEDSVIIDPFTDCDSCEEVVTYSISSTPYPILTKESLEITTFNVTNVYMHRTYFEDYTPLPEDLEITDFDILSGVFRALTYAYDSGEESIEIKDFDVDSAVFSAILRTYVCDSEDLEIKDFDIASAIFRRAVIYYTNGLPENLEIKDFTVTGGVHATA